ncbi:MAG: tryptophan 2,3-dioxygenase [Flavobacteriales bacterium]|nr:tryptophan 2,3-dioxygenase [Flavobacteriales bacterium]
MGQDINAYLDGLLLSNYLTYWDYVHLDTLLTLQHPKTDFPDEEIFIMYHQITELYFKLSLNEFDQICRNGRVIGENGHNQGWNVHLQPAFFTERLRRINSYFEALTKSFEIMVQGMEKDQFLKFRMALLPASGFQSAQYRMIEIASTDMARLIQKDLRQTEGEKDNRSIEEMFESIYWKQGATEAASGKKTLTLNQFEEKYSARLIQMARDYAPKNIWQKYLGLSVEDQKDPELVRQLRQLDVNVNVNWPLQHYKSAVRYLASKEGDAPATGGTNWQKYLPPRLQLRVFYPSLWSEEELKNWGRGWVEEVLVDHIKVKG